MPNSLENFHPKYRPDIDGLRALAVLGVVIFHAFPKFMPGGFIGVDVFFVISGYLISSIIFSNLQAQSFSFGDFYSRRIRRIFPALLTVLIVCYFFGWFALFADEYMQLGGHIAGGAGFATNFILWKEVGYFDQVSETKPLLHLWSLGIEEQFYLVWPLLLYFFWRHKCSLLVPTILLALASFGFNIYLVKVDSVADFYSPLTRFWELLLGSILAWVSLFKENYFSQLNEKIFAKDKNLNNILSILGLLILIGGFFGMSRSIAFPGWWALVPVIGSLLMLIAGPFALVNRRFLSCKIMVWIGLISFPLYLWHWPLLSFVRIVESKAPDLITSFAAIGFSFFLASLTYYFIERPIRYGKLVKSGSYSLIFMMFLIGLVGYCTYKFKGLEFRLQKYDQQNQKFISQIVVPPKLLRNTQCEKIFDRFNEGLCVLDQAKSPTVLIIGDSHGLHLYDGLAANLPGQNIGMLGGGWSGDPLNPLLGSYEMGTYGYKLQENIYQIIKDNDSIDTVILAFSEGVFSKSKANQNHLRETISYLLKIHKKVIFVLDVPTLPFDPKLCFHSRPFRLGKHMKDSCSYPRREYEQESEEYRAAVLSALSSFPQVSIFDAAVPMCDEKNCWGLKDGALLYRNGGENSHLSVDGSKFIAQSLAPFISSVASKR